MDILSEAFSNMEPTKTEVKKWGNSAAVRLSSKVLAAAHLNIDSPISIKVKGGKVIIEEIIGPRTKDIAFPFSEEDLLKGLTPHLAHADDLAGISDVELGE